MTVQIGEIIRRARQRQRPKMSQAQLAKALEVHVKTVQKWEAGEQLPTRHLANLEEVLGVVLTNRQPVAERPVELSTMTYQELVNHLMRVTAELARRGEPGEPGQLSVSAGSDERWSVTRRADINSEGQGPSEGAG